MHVTPLRSGGQIRLADGLSLDFAAVEELCLSKLLGSGGQQLPGHSGS